MTSETTLKRTRAGSESVTHGIRVTVSPAYSSLDSDPSNNYYKFIYRIRITNESDRVVQLVMRNWVIVDADGGKQEVRGEGVVGQQPILEPGRSFEYASFCPLGTSWGTMEGYYVMRWLSGEEGGVTSTVDDATPAAATAPADGMVSSPACFHASIARFFLVCPPEEQLSELV